MGPAVECDIALVAGTVFIALICLNRRGVCVTAGTSDIHYVWYGLVVSKLGNVFLGCLLRDVHLGMALVDCFTTISDRASTTAQTFSRGQGA